MLSIPFILELLLLKLVAFVLDCRWFCFGTWTSFIMLAGSVVLHAWSLVLWHEHKDAPVRLSVCAASHLSLGSCVVVQCEVPLATWLLVSAVSGYGVFAVSLFRRLLKKDACGFTVLNPTCLVLHGYAALSARTDSQLNLCVVPVCRIALVASVIWLIVGSFWSFRVDYNKHECVDAVFYYSFWLIVLQWCLLG